MSKNSKRSRNISNWLRTVELLAKERMSQTGDVTIVHYDGRVEKMPPYLDFELNLKSKSERKLP